MLTIKFNFIPKTLIAVLCSLYFLSACSSGASSSAFGSATNPSDGGVSGSSDGVASDTTFYVAVDSEVNTIAHVHKNTDFKTNCSIDPTESLKDITCIVDVPEAEIMTTGLALKYNIPPGMCRYLVRRPYWFYDQEIGVGPSSIVVNVTVSGDTTLAFDATVDGVAGGANVTDFREVTISREVEPVATCKYNATGSTVGANCCVGDYTYTVNKTDANTGGLIIEGPTQKNWGTSLSACTGGAGKTNWDRYDDLGLPQDVYDITKNGVNSTYNVVKQDDKVLFSNSIGIANYFTPATHTHTGFVDPRVSTEPYFIDPVDDRNGTALSSASAYYEFYCMDIGWEILHRIRVQVREWDTFLDFKNYVESPAHPEVPDRGSGIEGVNCTGLSGPCNDFYDIDNFVDLYLGAPYDTSIGNVNNRNELFPFWMR